MSVFSIFTGRVFSLAALLFFCAAPLCAAAKGQADAPDSLAGTKDDAMPLFDELGRPMNKGAEKALQDSGAGKPSEPVVDIMLNTPDQADALNEAMDEEKAGKKSRYLTRAVLFDLPLAELAERIKAGQDVNAVDPVFGRALSQAIEQRRGVAMIRFLLDHGANPNEGKPLLIALARGIPYDEVVSLLLAAGADPRTVDEDKTPVLTLAVRQGDAKTVAALLKAKAPADAPDRDGKTALYYALRRLGDRKKTQREIFPLLLDAGASVQAFPALNALAWSRENVDTALVLLKKGADATVVDKDEGSLLHWAIETDSPELLAAALKAGAPLNALDSNGYTALYRAVRKGRADFITALLNAGAPVNASVVADPGAKFVTAEGIYRAEDDILPRAVKKGNESVVKALIAGKVALDSRENSHDRPTALIKAIDQGQTDIVKMLLLAGARSDVADRYGRTPLHYAAAGGSVEIVRMLLAAKADPNARDDEGKIPLGAAKNPDVVKALKEAMGTAQK